MSQLNELVDIKKTVLTCKYGCEQEDDSVGLHGRRLGLSAIGTSSTLQSSYQAQAKNEKDKIISSQSEQQVSRCLRSTANKLLPKMDIFILIVFCRFSIPLIYTKIVFFFYSIYSSLIISVANLCFYILNILIRKSK